MAEMNQIKEQGHTPGPWSAVLSDVDPEDSIKAIVARDDRYHENIRTICICSAGAPHPDDPDDDEMADVYNCLLIAAAPDLLTACEAMVHAANMGDPALGGVAATLAAAAIAKAKGGQ